MPVNLERFFKAIYDPLSQRRGVPRLRAVFSQYRKFVATEPRQRDARAEQSFEAFSHTLEQLVTDTVAKTVVDQLEVIKVDHQQRATALMNLRRSHGLSGTVGKQ